MRLLIAAAVILISLAAPANAASIENARRLVDVMALQTEVDRAIDDSITQIRAQLSAKGVAPDKIDAFAASLRNELEAGIPALVDEFARLYADRFSDAEVNDLVAFYRSPTGQKLVEMQHELALEQVNVVAEWLMQAITEASSALTRSTGSV